MRSIELGWQYLGDLWLKSAKERELRRELSDCRNSPTLQGEGAARLIERELERRERAR